MSKIMTKIGHKFNKFNFHIYFCSINYLLTHIFRGENRSKQIFIFLIYKSDYFSKKLYLFFLDKIFKYGLKIYINFLVFF